MAALKVKQHTSFCVGEVKIKPPEDASSGPCDGTEHHLHLSVHPKSDMPVLLKFMNVRYSDRTRKRQTISSEASSTVPQATKSAVGTQRRLQRTMQQPPSRQRILWQATSIQMTAYVFFFSFRSNTRPNSPVHTFRGDTGRFVALHFAESQRCDNSASKPRPQREQYRPRISFMRVLIEHGPERTVPASQQKKNAWLITNFPPLSSQRTLCICQSSAIAGGAWMEATSVCRNGSRPISYRMARRKPRTLTTVTALHLPSRGPRTPGAFFGQRDPGVGREERGPRWLARFLPLSRLIRLPGRLVLSVRLLLVACCNGTWLVAVLLLLPSS